MEVDAKKVMNEIPNPQPYDVVRRLSDGSTVKVFRKKDLTPQGWGQLHEYRTKRGVFKVTREWYASDTVACDTLKYSFDEVDS
jgi:hypothetical protein